MSTTVTKKTSLTFPIWGWFFVFFAVVFVMDGIMVYLAGKTFNGVSVENAYEKGLAYNKAIAERKAQKDMGWQIGFTPNINPERLSGTLKFELQDESSKSLTGAAATLKIVRPTHNGYDRTLPLTETAPGVYSTPYTFPLKGQWRWEVQIKKGEEIAYWQDVFVIGQ